MSGRVVTFLLRVLGGAVYVAAIVVVVRLLTDRVRWLRWLRENWIYALTLIQTAGQYVLWAGASARPHDRTMEFAGLAIFGAMAISGLRWPVVLGAAWILHAAWDLALHPMPGTAWVPDWFPAFCVGFDIPLGAYILWRARGPRPAPDTAPAPPPC